MKYDDVMCKPAIRTKRRKTIRQEFESLSTCSQDVLSTYQDEKEITEQVYFVVEEGESFTTQAEGRDNPRALWP